MEIHLENNSNSWKTDSFAQSWGWGDILIAEGKRVERLSVVENGQVIMNAQVVYSPLPFGWQYAFCPKGPAVGVNLESRIVNHDTYGALADYLKKQGCLLFRFEPDRQFSIQDSRFKIQQSIDINPRTTTTLDLTKTEDELLAAMHQKTRYNIRLAEKKNVKIVSEKNYETFIALMKKTGERDGFRLHEEKHYRAIFDSNFSLQLTAQVDGKDVATAVFVGSGNTFTYLYGASDHEYRALMAPYLLQWEGMKLGKKMGYTKYDFFGIAPPRESRNVNRESRELYEYDPKHQYAGVTRFKLGFGGSVVEAPGTFDLILQPGKYKVYQLLRKLRRLV
jgi:lipid II:glycine glycyltransferase (peptidoglycan interpeptide bridge formation enzyme)